MSIILTCSFDNYNGICMHFYQGEFGIIKNIGSSFAYWLHTE